MTKSHLRSFSLPFLMASLTLVLGAAARAQAPASVDHLRIAEPLQIPGVPDAGKINAFLYRGGQPNKEGLQELKRLGVTTIVDLRGKTPDAVASERKQLQSLGLDHVSIPGNGWSPPGDSQVAEFFSLIRKQPRQKIFVHCWFGGDRTGVMIALYRMAFEGWTPDQALAEMHAYHFRSFWHPALKTYIRNFPALLARSPALAPFRRSQAPH